MSNWRYGILVLVLMAQGVLFGQTRSNQITYATTVVSPERFGNGALVYLVEGDNHMIRGQVEQSILAFDNAIAIDPYLAEAYMKRGIAKHRLGRTGEAEQDFMKANEINPYAMDLYSQRSDTRRLRVLALQGEVSISDRITAKDLATQLESIVEKQLDGDSSGALRDLDRLIRTDAGEHALLYKLRGNTYMMLGRYQQAANDYTKAILMDSSFAEAYFNRGMARLMLYNRPDGCFDLEQGVAMGYEAGTERHQMFCGF
jgi:tetratricopeptide (TPR) repeat protein